MYIDPELDSARKEMLAAVPGGFNSPSDIHTRRELINSFLALSPRNEKVSREDLFIQNSEGSPQVRIRIYRPLAGRATSGALMVIHGGGMVMGGIETDDANASFLCEALGILTVSSDYRLAPENPYPAALEDCYSVAQWIFAMAETLEIDEQKILLYGGSAGGGLAIALTMLLRDKGQPNFSYVMTPYPMIDNRNETLSSREILDLGVWDRQANLESWKWYLGALAENGANELPVYAAPSRAIDLGNLPPIFIDVGSCDLFRDEDEEFAKRLLEAGNKCEFYINRGAYHASELFAPEAKISKQMWSRRFESLRKALS